MAQNVSKGHKMVIRMLCVPSLAPRGLEGQALLAGDARDAGGARVPPQRQCDGGRLVRAPWSARSIRRAGMRKRNVVTCNAMCMCVYMPDMIMR
jgi:hypothetical protein